MRRLILSLILAVLVLAGCGGQAAHVQTSITTLSPVPPTVVQGHPCLPADTAMQCVLPPPAHLFGLGRSLYGVDFAWGGPRSCAAMRAIGAHFAIGYLSYDAAKNLGRTLAHQLHACGIPTVVGWETSANRAAQGFAAGVSDAHAAIGQAAADGNTNRPIWFAIDFDANGPEVLSYFQGVHSVLGARDEAYGSYRVILYLFHHRVVGHHNFQTYAWSGGLWLPASIAPLEQYLNGSSFDNDRAIAADYGQVPYAAAIVACHAFRLPNAAACYRRFPNARIRLIRGFSYADFGLPHPAVYARERRTVRTWDRHGCRNPVRRKVCQSSRWHMVLLEGRVSSLAHRRHPPQWAANQLGYRDAQLRLRLTKH